MDLKNIFTLSKYTNYLIKYRKLLLRIYKTQIQYPNDSIRVSIAYLYRIKIDNKYLLVKSHRITDQFQPVGGVYKYLPSAESTLRDLEVITEYGYIYDDDIDRDLRIELPGHNIPKLIKWFESGKDREISVTREFKEELVKTNILDKDTFTDINYNFLKRIICDIHYSDHFEKQELLIRDIYEIIPTPEQEAALKSTMHTTSNFYRWFSIDEIRTLGRVKGSTMEYNVGRHTLDIL